MSRYVDGFIVPVPEANLEAYLQLATLAGEVWKEYGALEYVECVADDVPEGEFTSFPLSVDLEKGEIVVFAWITYPSREARDEINKKVMADPRIADMGKDQVPFDGRRMIWGGFRTLVEM